MSVTFHTCLVYEPVSGVTIIASRCIYVKSTSIVIGIARCNTNVFIVRSRRRRTLQIAYKFFPVLPPARTRSWTAVILTTLSFENGFFFLRIAFVRYKVLRGFLENELAINHAKTHAWFAVVDKIDFTAGTAVEPL